MKMRRPKMQPSPTESSRMNVSHGVLDDAVSNWHNNDDNNARPPQTTTVTTTMRAAVRTCMRLMLRLPLQQPHTTILNVAACSVAQDIHSGCHSVALIRIPQKVSESLAPIIAVDIRQIVHVIGRARQVFWLSLIDLVTRRTSGG